MNTLLCNNGENLSKDLKIPTRCNPFLDGTYEVLNQDTPFHLSFITCKKLVATKGNIKSSYEFGSDDISIYFLKIGMPILAPHVVKYSTYLPQQVLFQILGK